MVWLALVVWVVVLLVVLPAGLALLPSLAALGGAAVAGLGTMIVFAITGPKAFAFISAGLAAIGVLASVFAAQTLVDDSAPVLEGVRDSIKGTAAMLVGLGLPLLLAAGLTSVGAGFS
jgi:hypothetical protein